MSKYIDVSCPRCRQAFQVQRLTGWFAGTEIASCPRCRWQFPAEFPKRIDSYWESFDADTPAQDNEAVQE